MAVLRAGGRRIHHLCLVIDVSMSMQGPVGDSVREVLIMLIAALTRLGLHNFSVLTFGETVRLIKVPDQPFDAATKALLAQALTFNEAASCDAEAIEVALDLLQMSASGRFPKKVFVFTDGS